MNLLSNPELIDRLAGSYAMGTLRGGARRRFEALAREHAPVRAAALLWRSRLAGLIELQPRLEPDPVVWTRIENLLRGEQEALAMQAARRSRVRDERAYRAGLGGWLRNLALWRGAAAVGAMATVAAVVVGLNMRQQLGGEIQALQARLSSTPQIAYVAVLSDDKAGASMLVTFDPASRKLTLQRVGGFREADDRSLQLWALPPSGGPRSLGVLGGEKVLQLTALEGDVREVPMLAISLEPKGGVPSATGPTGPVLFKGALIRKEL